MVYDKAGEAICTACGHYWDDHAVGGNCRHRAMTYAQYVLLLDMAKRRQVAVADPKQR